MKARKTSIGFISLIVLSLQVVFTSRLMAQGGYWSMDAISGQTPFHAVNANPSIMFQYKESQSSLAHSYSDSVTISNNNHLHILYGIGVSHGKTNGLFCSFRVLGYTQSITIEFEAGYNFHDERETIF